MNCEHMSDQNVRLITTVSDMVKQLDESSQALAKLGEENEARNCGKVEIFIAGIGAGMVVYGGIIALFKEFVL